MAPAILWCKKAWRHGHMQRRIQGGSIGAIAPLPLCKKEEYIKNAQRISLREFSFTTTQNICCLGSAISRWMIRIWKILAFCLKKRAPNFFINLLYSWSFLSNTRLSCAHGREALEGGLNKNLDILITPPLGKSGGGNDQVFQKTICWGNFLLSQHKKSRIQSTVMVLQLEDDWHVEIFAFFARKMGPIYFLSKIFWHSWIFLPKTHLSSTHLRGVSTKKNKFWFWPPLVGRGGHG